MEVEKLMEAVGMGRGAHCTIDFHSIHNRAIYTRCDPYS